MNQGQKVNSEEDETMLPEYEFTHGVRGGASRSVQGGTQCDFPVARLDGSAGVTTPQPGPQASTLAAAAFPMRMQSGIPIPW